MDQTLENKLTILRTTADNQLIETITNDFLNTNPHKIINNLAPGTFEEMPLIFYKKLADQLVQDLSNNELSYIFDWHFRLQLFLPETVEQIFSLAYEPSNNTPAEFYIKGMQRYWRNDYRMAARFLDRGKAFWVDYFIGNCQHILENAEEEYKHFKAFDKIALPFLEEQPDATPFLAKFNSVANIRLGDLYCTQNDFQEAVNRYEEAMEYKPLEELITSSLKNENDLNKEELEFSLSNYLNALKQVNQQDRQTEILQVIHLQLPNFQISVLE